MKKIGLIFLCATMLFYMGGCAKDAKPSTSVEGFINALKDQNQEEMNSFSNNEISNDDIFNFDGVDNDTLSESQKKLWDSLIIKMSEVEYTIKEEGSTKSNSSTVTVSITTYNFGDKLKSGLQEAFKSAFSLAFDSSISEEEKNNKITDILINNLISAEKNYTKEVTVNLIKDEKAWKIDSQNNADFFDALCGGMKSIAEELSNSFNK